MPGKVCSENRTKSVLRYASTSVTKHIILQNTPERVSNLGQARNTTKKGFWEHTKVCLDNSPRCVRVTHEKACISTHLCVCCFEDENGVLHGTMKHSLLWRYPVRLFPIKCTDIWQKRLASTVIQTSERWNVQRNRHLDSNEITEWLSNLNGKMLWDSVNQTNGNVK